MVSAGSLAGGTSSSVSAAPTWAPAAAATVHPGVQLYTNGAQCTANFIFTNRAHVYVGQAAHCSSTDATGTTDGCTASSLPLGTPVDIRGAKHPGKIVYSSWLTMKGLHETDSSACRYNDLALVELDPADLGSVNPSIPTWGGPVGISAAGTSTGEQIYGYGHSELAMGLAPLASKQGVSLGDCGNGWSHRVLTRSPGIPGDSGSAYLDSQGRALGVLSTVDLVPVPGTNGVGDLSRELAYLHSHTDLGGVQPAFGTEAFTAGSPPGSGTFRRRWRR
jgi:hypothetical protein